MTELTPEDRPGGWCPEYNYCPVARLWGRCINTPNCILIRPMQTIEAHLKMHTEMNGDLREVVSFVRTIRKLLKYSIRLAPLAGIGYGALMAARFLWGWG